MGLWEDHLLPRLVEATCGGDDLRPLREEACAGLSGRVLELGFGAGLNVAHYPAPVTEVRAVEPNDTAWRRAQPRIRRSPVRVVRSGLDGQRLVEDDGSVDHVLSTFTLCSIPDVDAALAELHRVLVPGGQVHFVEHGLAPDPGVRRWQRRLEPLERRVAGGCHLTRRPDAAMEAAGLEVTGLVTAYLPGPAVNRPFAYLYRGCARRPA